MSCPLIHSNLVNMTLVYMTPSILRHIFARTNFLVQNSLFYMTTTLDNATFRTYVCHFKEVVDAIIPFICVRYILLAPFALPKRAQLRELLWGITNERT